MSRSKFITNNSKIFICFYILYIVLTTFSKFTAYYPYLHLVYEITVLFSIAFNLIFIFVLNINQSKYDMFGLIFAFLVISGLVFGFITKLQIITVPLAAIYLFIINLRYINLDYFIKNDFKIKCLLLIVIILLYVFHLFPSSAYSIEFRNGIPRLSMGFSVYTMFSSFVFCIILSYIILLRERILQTRYLLGILIISIIVFLLTDSRGPLISEIIIVLLLFLCRINQAKVVIRLISIPIVLFMSIVAILVPLKTPIGTSSFYFWNKMFSNRLVLQQTAVKTYPIKYFGYGHINLNILSFLNNGNKIYIDNTYLMIMLVCGIIGFLVFEYLLIKSCYIAIRSNSYILCTLFISLSVLFVTEIYFNDINLYAPIICAFILGYPSTEFFREKTHKY